FSRDWSSDVCSSDLHGFILLQKQQPARLTPAPGSVRPERGCCAKCCLYIQCLRHRLTEDSGWLKFCRGAAFCILIAIVILPVWKCEITRRCAIFPSLSVGVPTSAAGLLSVIIRPSGSGCARRWRRRRP